jgi:hypothetical protein
VAKWLLSVVLIVILAGLLAPQLPRRWRPGRLPGDVSWRWRGRGYSFPFASTLLLSLLVYLLLRVLP